MRTGRLTDEPGTGRIRVSERVEDGDISRDDVAVVLAFSAHHPALAGVVFEIIIAADTPIEQALTGCRSLPASR